MSEGHGDDVRSFLPRPGEPVEDYAQRLRALHRDLTLVLEAVERGLAAAGGAPPAPPAPPAVPADPGAADASHHDAGQARPGDRPIDIVPAEIQAQTEADLGASAPLQAVPGRSGGFGARVEVMPAPSGERRRDDAPDERAAPRPAHFPARPSAAHASDAPAREPEWVEDPDEAAARGFTAPTFPPAGSGVGAVASSGGGSRPAISPLLAAAFVAGWLVVVALLVALLVS